MRAAFGDDGAPVDPVLGIRLQVMLEDLAWWSAALEKARAGGELTPGTLRAGRGPVLTASSADVNL